MRVRIKAIRKYANMTQSEFGIALGLGATSAAAWEKKDAQIPTESMQLLICKTFGINKHWLETGEGDMLDDVPDPLEEICRQRGLSPLACGIVKDFVEMDADQREAFLSIARRLFAAGESAARSAQSAAIRSEAAMSERPNPVPSVENPDSRTAN